MEPAQRLIFRIGSLLCLVTASSLWLSGCASANLELNDASFTGDQLKGSKIAIAGLIDTSNCGIRSADSSKMLQYLGSQLKSRRAKATVVSFSEFKRISGSGSAFYQSKSGPGVISSTRKARARKAGIRYLMFIEVSSNNISHDISRSVDETTAPIYDSEGREVGCEVVDKDYITTAYTYRKMTSKYRIYDLELNKSVWVTSSSFSNSNSDSCESSFHYPPAPPYPSPPSIENNVAAMSRAAIRKLPRVGFR